MADARPQQADAGYKPLHALTTAEDLVKKCRQLRQGRGSLENQWKLNLAFYKGRQYSYIQKTTGTIQSLPVDDGEKPRYRVRLVSNQIVSGVHSLLAKYTKTKPIITATPGSSSPSDVKAAQMAERLLEFWWDEFSLDSKLEEALLWALIAGQGYWKISWDPHAATQMRFTLLPDGTPVTDDALKEAFTAQLQQQGVQPVEKIVYLGDIRVEPISPFDVYLDPLAKTFEEAKYAICVHHLSPEEVKARWGKDVQPDATSTQADISLPFMGGVSADDTTQKDVRRVYTGYFPPQPAMPDGRYVTWIEGPDEILEDAKWPEGWPNELPLVKFPGLRIPGSVYDSSHVEQSIPLQKLVNRILSSITEYMNLMLKPRYLAPTGSLRQRLTSEPGQVLEYNPINNLKPEPEQLPTIPPYVFEHLQEVTARLRDVFGLTDVGEGQLPPNLEAGIAIDLLQEMSTDRHAPAIKLLEKALSRAGGIMLEFAQKYYIEPRLMLIKGSGGSVQVKKFLGKQLNGVSIHVETGSGLPRTRAGRQARIEKLVEMGVVPPDKAYKYLDLADMQSLTAQFAADEDQAQREIDKLIKGAPINPEAAQAAMAAVNQGMNPDTGQPLGINGNDPMAEAQQILQTAGLKPLVGENYAAHLDVLGLFMKGVEFEALPPDVRQRMVMHFQLTQQAASALPAQVEPGKVNTNLQIKATLGPTAAAKVMQKQGVPITPEEMAEPPLETWVSDSVDKPDTDAAGPGQEANQLTEAAVTVIESQQKIADAQLKAQTHQEKHELDMEAKRREMDQQQIVSGNGNPDARDEEMHAQKVRKAAAEADLAEKKLRQSDFKPKPKEGASTGKRKKKRRA